MFYERLRTAGKNKTRSLEFRFRDICTIWYSKVKRENILCYIVVSYDINCLLRRNVIEIFVDSFLVFQPVLSAKLVYNEIYRLGLEWDLHVLLKQYSQNAYSVKGSYIVNRIELRI